MDFAALRTRLGLNTAGAAALFRVSRRAWQLWEAGQRPTGPALVLAELLLEHPEMATSRRRSLSGSTDSGPGP